MEIQKETIDTVKVLSPIGRIDSQTAGAFQEEVIGLIEGGQSNVIMDFSQVDYISSAGLRVVLMAAKRCKAAQGTYAMFGLADHIKEVFEISGFLKILTLVEDKETALNLFA